MKLFVSGLFKEELGFFLAQIPACYNSFCVPLLIAMPNISMTPYLETLVFLVISRLEIFIIQRDWIQYSQTRALPA